MAEQEKALKQDGFKQNGLVEQPKEKVNSRLFYGKIAVVGPSGSGKSYLSKTADKDTTGYINVENKPLPYRTTPFKFHGVPKTWAGFIKCLRDYAANPEIKRIIIDSQTMAFSILNSEMKKNFTNWDVAKNYNTQVYEYLTFLKEIPKEVIVFSHDELLRIGDSGKQKRMVVHNKEFEGKIEEQFTIVLYTGTRIEDEKPKYFLRTFEEDTSTKTPEGMFPDKNGDNLLEIPNDAKFIFDAVEKYYSL